MTRLPKPSRRNSLSAAWVTRIFTCRVLPTGTAKRPVAAALPSPSKMRATAVPRHTRRGAVTHSTGTVIVRPCRFVLAMKAYEISVVGQGSLARVGAVETGKAATRAQPLEIHAYPEGSPAASTKTRVGGPSAVSRPPPTGTDTA